MKYTLILFLFLTGCTVGVRTLKIGPQAMRVISTTCKAASLIQMEINFQNLKAEVLCSDGTIKKLEFKENDL